MSKVINEAGWHFRMMQQDNHVCTEITEACYQAVLDHVLSGFGNYLRHDMSLACEAALRAFQEYFDNPAIYHPQQGSLCGFLKMLAVRKIQMLLEKENRPWHFQHLQFLLSRYLDCDQDMQIARMLLRGKYDWARLATILDVGGLPIMQQLREIKRNIRRVRAILDRAPIQFTTVGNKRETSSRKIKVRG